MNTVEQNIDIKCSAINRNVKIIKMFSIECGSTCSMSISTEEVRCKNMSACDAYKNCNSKCLVRKELEMIE